MELSGGDKEAAPTGAARGKPPWRPLLIAAGIVVALAVVAGVIFGPTLLRPPSTTSGLPETQIRADFLADQDAQDKALESGAANQASGYITGNALQDLQKRLEVNQIAGVGERTQRQDTSIEVLQAVDPNDPQTNIEVHQSGYARTTLIDLRTGTPLSQRDVRFDNRYWLRPLNGRYAITDQVVSQELGSPPTTPWLLIGIGVAAVIAVGLALAVMRRQRRLGAAAALGRIAPPEPGAAAAALEPPDLPAPIWAGGPPNDLAIVGIRTMGGLQIWSEGQDLGPTLLRNEVAGFMLLRLLIQEILEPGSRMTRDELGEETFSKIPATSQHSRTRKRLHAIRKYTPALAERLREDSGLSFDLTGCRVDAIEVLELARSCSGNAVLPPELVPKAEQLSALTSGRFLPFWDTLEKKATGIEGASGELVELIRGRLEIARADILAALGATHVASGQAQRAVAILEEARRMRPERQDIANQLVVAYRATGRDAEAERVLDGSDVES